MAWYGHRASVCLNTEWFTLLQSPSLVAVGLSVGYETWPPIGCFMIGSSKDRLGLHSAPLHYGLTWPVGILTVFQTPVTVPLHCPNDRQLPAVRTVQGDCERVYEWFPPLSGDEKISVHSCTIQAVYVNTPKVEQYMEEWRVAWNCPLGNLNEILE